MKKYRNGIASTSIDAYNKRKQSGKEASQKDQVLAIFKSGGTYSIYSMHKATGIAEKSISGIFNRLRLEWKIIFSHEAKNSTKSNANYFRHNPSNPPPQSAILWEIKEMERTMLRQNTKQEKGKERLKKLYQMLLNKKSITIK